MKTCTSRKKQIAWMVLNILPPEETRRLRAHLESCAACHRYWQQVGALCRDQAAAAALLPEVPCDEAFHERLKGRIEAEVDPGGATKVAKAFLAGIRWRPKMAIAGAALAAVAIMLALSRPSRKEAFSPPQTVQTAPSLMPAPGNSPPTLSAYRMALNRSIEALEEMLTEEASRSASPPETMTFLALRRTDLGN